MIYNMSMRYNRNKLDVEEGISDFKTPVYVEGTKKLRSKQSAWVSMFFYIPLSFAVIVSEKINTYGH